VLSGWDFEKLLRGTLVFWRRWLSKSTYRGRWREQVHRSALVLKLMVYDPTGRLVAAPTMGPAGEIGGERNWDYRYAWLRDAAFTLYALISIGFDHEAYRFMGWLRDSCAATRTASSSPSTASTAARDRERNLDHLSGYMDSKPVRLGNAAYGQIQLDLYGAILDAAYLYNKHGAPLDYDLWQNLRRILDWLCDNWHFEDEGIWEVRGGRRHFVSSKVMSWVALERAVRISRQRGLPAGNGGELRWIGERDKIYEEVMEKGWNPKKGSFVQYYGADALDASLLLMPLVKFVGPTDPRWISTLDHIQSELTYDTLVDRYKTDAAAPDGLAGDEAPSASALSGSWSASPRPAASTRPASPSKRCSPTPTTSASTPKRSAPPARPSATSPRPSPTSPS
jgi:GH15 family glucan-1,4-alpha-glucosidase